MEAEKTNILSIAKAEELLEFLNRIGLKVDKSVIESTDSDTIVELFATILEKLGVLKKDRLKINFQGMEIFAYNGLHDRPIYIMKLYKLSRKFITEILKVDNYAPGDLFTPNPKRTKKILSKIYAFYRFKQEHQHLFSTQINKMNEYVYKLNEDNSRQEKLKQNLEVLRMERQYDRNNLDIMTEEIAKTNSYIGERETEYHDFKEKEKELNDQIAQWDEKNVNIN
jgi:hypothetical protein